jgi:aryl-alcohol dehydrogenase-like predicted oxidoreductase
MDMNRREFLRVSAATAALAGVQGVATAAPRNGMPYRVLGKTGEEVSLLCLGGYHIGHDRIEEADSIRLMRTAVDEGVNFFDNAWEYNDGRSEERMGMALRDGYRDKVFLMTKHHGREPELARQHLEDSLRRLQTDVIDLWQFHEVIRPHEPAAIYGSGALEVALKAQEEGKIRYIGFTGHRYPTVHAAMIDGGFPWDTVQMPLNICDHHFRSFEQLVLPKALERNIGVIGMKSLGGGSIPEKSKVATIRECMHYSMSLPVSSLASGIDSIEKLEENLAIAREFEPLAETQVAELLARAKPVSAEAEFEPYKEAWYRRA